MKQGKRASKNAPDMTWRIDMIRKAHMRLLSNKATAIETQQAQAKTARADELQHGKDQKQVQTYILAILMKQEPVVVHATA